MEKSDQETLATVTLSTPALSASADVNVNEHRTKKQKFYKQHFLALLERCEFIQQVKYMVHILISDMVHNLSKTDFYRPYSCSSVIYILSVDCLFMQSMCLRTMNV